MIDTLTALELLREQASAPAASVLEAAIEEIESLRNWRGDAADLLALNLDNVIADKAAVQALIGRAKEELPY